MGTAGRGEFIPPRKGLFRLSGHLVEAHHSLASFGQTAPLRSSKDRFPGLYALVALQQERFGLGVLLLGRESSPNRLIQ